MKKVVLAIFAAATAVHSVQAAPANPFAKERAVLNLRGLDLSTPEGQRRLSIRMDHAARSVCGDRVASIHLALQAQSQACQSDVLAGIRAKIEQRSASTQQARGSTQLAMR